MERKEAWHLFLGELYWMGLEIALGIQSSEHEEVAEVSVRAWRELEAASGWDTCPMRRELGRESRRWWPW
jgi:hypothetical protein